jgi:hypothetical protein
MFWISANRQTCSIWWNDRLLTLQTDEMWCATGYIYSQQNAKEASKGKALRTLDKIVPEHYWDFSKVFSKEESNWLPMHKVYNRVIDLKPDAPELLRSKVYPMPVNKQAELNWFLEENLKKGYIVPLKFPMLSPLFFIKKKDGKLCLIQHYQNLTAVCINIGTCEPRSVVSRRVTLVQTLAQGSSLVVGHLGMQRWFCSACFLLYCATQLTQSKAIYLLYATARTRTTCQRHPPSRLAHRQSPYQWSEMLQKCDDTPA